MSDVECFLKLFLHDLYKRESFNILDSPGATSRLLLCLDDWEHFNTVLHQDGVKLGDVLLPLHRQPSLHLQQSRDVRSGSDNIRDWYCGTDLSDDQTVRANIRDRVNLQNDWKIVLDDHVEGGKAAQVEGSVGHLGHLGHLQHHLPSQGLAGGRDGGLRGVVRAVEDLALRCDLRDREGLQ